MATPSARLRPERNHILDLLPAADRRRLDHVLDRREFRVRDPVYASGQRIREVYFPLSGVLSYVIRMKDGTAVEIATVGKEGIVGTQIFLGADRSPTESFCQIECTALFMSADAFREA